MEQCSKPSVLVLVGPTGVGKSATAVTLAQHYRCPIIGADSRQIYKELHIGVATPTEVERGGIQHYLIGTHSITEEYNAGMYQRECMGVLEQLPIGRPIAIICGGSMLYVDAVCKGVLDDVPRVSEEVRTTTRDEFKQKGLGCLQEEVQRCDTNYWEVVDRSNPQRLLHCVEVYRQTGQPLTSFWGRKKEEEDIPFQFIKVGLRMEREKLYERINKRVDGMMEQGLLEEVRGVYQYKNYNSLQTVGYKELFAYIDGRSTLQEAVRMIKQNSRHYAKRQMTWLNADKTIYWINIDTEDEASIIHHIDYLFDRQL